MQSRFKTIVSVITAIAVAWTSMLLPLQAYASDRAAHTIDDTIDPFNYSRLSRDMYSRGQCAVNTKKSRCPWQHTVPLDYWETVAALHNPRGADGPVDGRANFEGQRWMALGLDAAGILGLESADIVYKTMQQQMGQPPWVIGRYLPETAELRIHAVKVMKTLDGFQRVLVADFTPDHGRWHIVWRHFLRPEEKRNDDIRGIDPFVNFSRGLNTKTFVNVAPGTAQAIMGQAMMHYHAPFGLLIEPQLSLKQWQTTGGNFLRKTITTHTEGYARPRIYFAAPLNMTAGFNSPDPRAMGMYCPRKLCQMAEEVVGAGVIFEEVTGGNIPDITELIYKTEESKSSFTAIFFALVTAALTWGVGATMSGSTSWGFSASTGFAPVGSVPGAVSGASITTASGFGYAALSALTQGVNLTDPQRDWLGASGLDPRTLTNGTMTGAQADNQHAQALYEAASARHIQTGNPGTAQADGNLRGTNAMITGNCPLDWGIHECEKAGLDPGQAPRKDMHTNRATTSATYTRKIAACKKAGLGRTKKELNYCLATRVFIEPPTGNEPVPPPPPAPIK